MPVKAYATFIKVPSWPVIIMWLYIKFHTFHCIKCTFAGEVRSGITGPSHLIGAGASSTNTQHSGARDGVWVKEHRRRHWEPHSLYYSDWTALRWLWRLVVGKRCSLRLLMMVRYKIYILGQYYCGHTLFLCALTVVMFFLSSRVGWVGHFESNGVWEWQMCVQLDHLPVGSIVTVALTTQPLTATGIHAAN